MRTLAHQTTEYLSNFKDRIEKENKILDGTMRETVSKINYILECREKGEKVKMCRGVCDGSCWTECENNC